MNQNQIAALYRQVSTRGASPVGLVVQLYDIIFSDLQRALEALAAGDIERRTAKLSHALLVIAELQNTLDHERGGEVARRLKNFYNVTRGMILEANIRCSAEAIQKIMDLYMPLRQAWQQVEQEISAGPVNSVSQGQGGGQVIPSAESAPQAQPVGVGADAETSHSHWSA
jgi:flagellar protein FliS